MWLVSQQVKILFTGFENVFKENTAHRIVYALDRPEHSPIQFLRIGALTTVPGARLVEVEVAGPGDNIALGMLDRGGKLDVVLDAFAVKKRDELELGTTRVIVDGDLFTRWAVRRATQAKKDVFSHLIMDLGATYWVDRVKIIGGVVVRGGFSGGITTSYRLVRRSFNFWFYEVMTSDGALAPNGSLIWDKHFSGTSTVFNRTVSGTADHEFELVPTRHVRLLWKSWEAASRSSYRAAAEELQVYGEGYPQNVTFQSPLIDLGDTKSINSVTWLENTPPGARIEIRTRSGNEVAERLIYHDKNDKVVTEKRYDKLIKSFRGKIDTVRTAGGDWSTWSKIYSTSGQEFQSPSPRRLMQFQISMVGDVPEAAATLKDLVGGG